VLGPGTWQFARGDASAPRQPSLYAVPSSYVVAARDAAASQQLMMTGLTAALAVGVIWYLGKKK